MTPVHPCAIAENFRGVEYRFHRNFFELLGHHEVATVFADIWNLCERHMDVGSHKSLADGREPAVWAAEFSDVVKQREFLGCLCAVLESEADGDENRGRRVLAGKLRVAVAMLRGI